MPTLNLTHTQALIAYAQALQAVERYEAAYLALFHGDHGKRKVAAWLDEAKGLALKLEKLAGEKLEKESKLFREKWPPKLHFPPVKEPIGGSDPIIITADEPWPWAIGGADGTWWHKPEGDEAGVGPLVISKLKYMHAKMADLTHEEAMYLATTGIKRPNPDYPKSLMEAFQTRREPRIEDDRFEKLAGEKPGKGVSTKPSNLPTPIHFDGVNMPKNSVDDLATISRAIAQPHDHPEGALALQLARGGNTPKDCPEVPPCPPSEVTL